MSTTTCTEDKDCQNGKICIPDPTDPSKNICSCVKTCVGNDDCKNDGKICIQDPTDPIKNICSYDYDNPNFNIINFENKFWWTDLKNDINLYKKYNNLKIKVENKISPDINDHYIDIYTVYVRPYIDNTGKVTEIIDTITFNKMTDENIAKLNMINSNSKNVSDSTTYMSNTTTPEPCKEIKYKCNIDNIETFKNLDDDDNDPCNNNPRIFKYIQNSYFYDLTGLWIYNANNGKWIYYDNFNFEMFDKPIHLSDIITNEDPTSNIFDIDNIIGDNTEYICKTDSLDFKDININYYYKKILNNFQFLLGEDYDDENELNISNNCTYVNYLKTNMINYVKNNITNKKVDFLELFGEDYIPHYYFRSGTPTVIPKVENKTLYEFINKLSYENRDQIKSIYFELNDDDTTSNPPQFDIYKTKFKTIKAFGSICDKTMSGNCVKRTSGQTGYDKIFIVDNIDKYELPEKSFDIEDPEVIEIMQKAYSIILYKLEDFINPGTIEYIDNMIFNIIPYHFFYYVKIKLNKTMNYNLIETYLEILEKNKDEIKQKLHDSGQPIDYEQWSIYLKKNIQLLLGYDPIIENNKIKNQNNSSLPPITNYKTEEYNRNYTNIMRVIITVLNSIQISNEYSINENIYLNKNIDNFCNFFKNKFSNYNDMICNSRITLTTDDRKYCLFGFLFVKNICNENCKSTDYKTNRNLININVDHINTGLATSIDFIDDHINTGLATSIDFIESVTSSPTKSDDTMSLKKLLIIITASICLIIILAIILYYYLY